MSNMIGHFLVAVGAIIESPDGKILLSKRSAKKDFCPDIWEYTTGRLNQFEDPEDGLKREVMEETGLKIKPIKPVSIFHFFRGEKKAENELVGIVYWCRTKSKKVKTSEETTDFMWVTPQKALKIVSHLGIKQDIKNYIRNKNAK